MRRKQTPKSAPKEIQIETTSGWRFKRISDDLLSLIRTMWFDKEVKVGDALGPHWTLSICTIEKGRARFFRGSELVNCPSKYAMFMPAHSLMRGIYEGVHMTANGLVWFGTEPKGFPNKPVIFQPSKWKLPQNAEQAKDFIASGKRHVEISAVEGASALTLRAKREIDRTFRSDQKLSVLAKKLHTTPAYLSRVFKRESGFSLSEYRTQMRVSTAAFELLRNRAIADVFQDVGYADLSRFYKQFRKLTTATPGAYLGKSKTKNAKT